MAQKHIQERTEIIPLQEATFCAELPLSLEAITEVRDELKARPGKGKWLWLLGLGALAGAAVLALKMLRPTAGKVAELKTARGVHLVRLAGDWYEIARMPGQIEKSAVGLQLTFELLDPQHIELSYSWREGSFEGPLHSEKRSITVPDPRQPARLKKQLMGDLSFDYWILEYGGHYDYLVLGTPSRQHLWILSRSPEFSDQAYQAIVKRMQHQGFDVDKLQRVPQQVQQEQKV